MSAVMRAKLKVDHVERHGESETLHFRAVCKSEDYPADGSDENNSYARWTPQADLKMVVNNPALLGKFTAGQAFYVDFTPAD